MSKIGLAESLRHLSQENVLFQKFFSHGSLEVELYKPNTVDLQKPHDRDEIYVIVSGQSHFTQDDQQVGVVSGDVLFVPAYAEHRFSDFSEDFATWVFFYGPKGGENQCTPI